MARRDGSLSWNAKRILGLHLTASHRSCRRMAREMRRSRVTSIESCLMLGRVRWRGTSRRRILGSRAGCVSSLLEERRLQRTQGRQQRRGGRHACRRTRWARARERLACRHLGTLGRQSFSRARLGRRKRSLAPRSFRIQRAPRGRWRTSCTRSEGERRRNPGDVRCRSGRS
jgi:hypothetical protein